MAFSYSQPIVIDHTKCGGSDSTNFPFLFTGTFSFLATIGNGGFVQSASGYDIGFYSDNALSSKLNWETVNWTNLGVVTYWVQVPTLSHTTDTVVWIAYGDSGVSSDQSNKNATWDTNYKGVWHFEENAANTTVNDSTGNANAAGTGSVNTSTISAAGIIGNGFLFPSAGSTDIALTGTLLTTAVPLTLSWWEKVTTDTNVFLSRMVLATSAAAHYLAFRATRQVSGYNYLSWGPDPVASTPGCFSAASVTAPGNSLGIWNYIVITATTPETTTPANTACYFNGVSQAVGQVSGNAFSAIAKNQLGWDSADNGTDAVLDEMRVSSGLARSVDWALAEYNNQSGSVSFWKFPREATINTRYWH